VQESAPTSAPAPAPKPEVTPAPPQESAPVGDDLKPVEDLAAVFRLPTWQSAALHRMMGWEPGKRVTEAAYTAGLARLKTRRIGG
jgi:hypothetical protein